MVLTSKDLPSGGLLGNANPVSFRPLNFVETIEYNAHVVDNSIKRYIRDIKFLEKLDEGILQHSLYDLDYLIFMMKINSISEDVKYTTLCDCQFCGDKQQIDYSLKDFKFKDIPEEKKRIKSVLLGGMKYPVRIPTIEDFLYVVDKYNKYKKTDNIDVVKLISLFPEFKITPNVIEEAVLNSSRGDIAVLNYLEAEFLTSVEALYRTCSNCNKERGVAIRIDSLIASLFREILLNNSSLESKIQFE